MRRTSRRLRKRTGTVIKSKRNGAAPRLGGTTAPQFTYQRVINIRRRVRDLQAKASARWSATHAHFFNRCPPRPNPCIKSSYGHKAGVRTRTAHIRAPSVTSRKRVQRGKGEVINILPTLPPLRWGGPLRRTPSRSDVGSPPAPQKASPGTCQMEAFLRPEKCRWGGTALPNVDGAHGNYYLPQLQASRP